MKRYFNNIGIIGIPRHDRAFVTHEILYYWLNNKGYNVYVEKKILDKLFLIKPMALSLSGIGKCCNLALVIGGDGNILRAGRALCVYTICMIGINRGNFGFLTDLNYKTIFANLKSILSGKFFIENRFILEVSVYRNNSFIAKSKAINEFVIHPKNATQMIEFDVLINKKFAFSQCADGLIISTPTGSTGYSLSAGGPVLESSLDAIILIPMSPHTLSVRPLIIHNKNIVSLKFHDFPGKLRVTCDSQKILSIKKNDTVVIYKSKYNLSFLHPIKYNYFNILSDKLNWSKKFFPV
ncbi:NAD(+)/NADH kinase [Buchnera aphidicola (Mollitrichosiphum nigrofasciatum)]|uniref:NAD(+)/NADH kinase n=1 Tax=Buchnera aphidicola TaxID=9 RepID=UPI0031B86011